MACWSLIATELAELKKSHNFYWTPCTSPLTPCLSSFEVRDACTAKKLNLNIAKSTSISDRRLASRLLERDGWTPLYIQRLWFCVGHPKRNPDHVPPDYRAPRREEAAATQQPQLINVSGSQEIHKTVNFLKQTLLLVFFFVKHLYNNRLTTPTVTSFHIFGIRIDFDDPTWYKYPFRVIDRPNDQPTSRHTDQKTIDKHGDWIVSNRLVKWNNAH